MPRKWMIRVLALVGLSLIVGTLYAQESPLELSVCDLARHPKLFDGKIIRVRGTLSVYFEDFSLVIPNCGTQQAIWLAFGGDVPGIVASTVNDTSRKPGTDVKVNGVPYGIKKDENFRRLYALIAARNGDKPVYRVTATLTGAFFAGNEHKLPNGQTFYMGYGHLGCCSLFVITQVSDVESAPPADLNVRGTVVGAEGKPMEGIVVFDDILGGSPPVRQRAITNKKGEFEFSDSGQLLQIQDPRYRPLALSVEPGKAPVRARLEDAKQTNWVIPWCGQTAESAGRIGFSVLFSLPATLESSPVNYAHWHAYWVFPRGGNSDEAEFFITTEANREADDNYAGDYERTEERWIEDSTGTLIGTDSRSQLKNGRHWRTAIFWNRTTAGYRTRRGEPTSSLDKVIDSACLLRK